MKIVFASANKNKIEEIKSLIPRNIQLLGLADIQLDHEIPETGTTIRENSFLKADHVKEFLTQKGLVAAAVFADDSGLEVEILGNAPGVYSARYAGEPKSDVNNNNKLLGELRNATNRRARFVTVITLIIDGSVHYFEGKVKGTIAFEPKGNSGFGYDPLFIPQGYRSTFAALGPDVKNAISHRAMAVKKLLEFLKNRYISV